MALFPVKTPGIAKKMFPNYIWELPSNKKVIYLTFDDGPTEQITPWVLEKLESFNAKATFFVIGENVKKHPKIFNTILEQGHEIGNHTYNHLKGWKTKTDDYLYNVEKCGNIIKSQTLSSITQNSISKPFANRTLNLFRPPYGKLKLKQGKRLNELGYKIIMWDVLSFDWDNNISPEACLKKVISKTTSGSIVVFHDSRKAAKNMQYALPKMLAHFRDLGYVFKALKL